MPRYNTVFASIVTLLTLIQPLRGSAAEFNFINVADPDTNIPSGTGTFEGVAQPALSVGKVVFKGWGTGNQIGIYERDVNDAGSLVMLVNETTAVPGGSGFFDDFGNPSFHDGDLAFTATGTAGESGVYTIIDGTLAVLADKTTPIPGGAGTFTSFQQPTIKDGVVAFEGSGSGQEGIYTTLGGTLRVVADLSTNVPGGMGTFTKFNGNADIDNGEIVFGDSALGVYLESEGSLSVIADMNTPVPGGGGNFGYFQPGFNRGRLNDGTILFAGGASSGDFALYRVDNGVFSVIVDTNTTVPGTAVPFANFGVQAIGVSGTNVAFLGQGADIQATQAVFTTLGGDGVELIRVAGNGDMVDGTVISTLGCYVGGIDGNTVTFNVGNYGAIGGFGDSANFVAVLVTSTTTTTNTTTSTVFPTTTTTLPATPDDLVDDLDDALPDPDAATGKARRSAKMLAKFERRARGKILKGLAATGAKQRKRYRKARRDLQKLLKIARKANRKGRLGADLGEIEDAVAALMALLET